MFEAEEEIAPRYAIHGLQCLYYSIFLHLKNKKLSEAEEESGGGGCATFRLSAERRRQSNDASARPTIKPGRCNSIETFFPSLKSFMILGILVLDSWSGFGLTDALRLSISDIKNNGASFNNSFDPSKYDVFWGHYYGPGSTNPRKNCQNHQSVFGKSLTNVLYCCAVAQSLILHSI